jgi:hypothetical protein
MRGDIRNAKTVKRKIQQADKRQRKEMRKALRNKAKETKQGDQNA